MQIIFLTVIMYKNDCDLPIEEIYELAARKSMQIKDADDSKVRDIVTRIVFEKTKGRLFTQEHRKSLIDKVFNSLRRMDILQPLIDDESINEIMINGTDAIFIEKEGSVKKLDYSFENQDKLLDLIFNLLSRTNRTVNEASPIVDARLPDGSRLNIVLPPVSLRSPVITIRKFPKKPMTMERLITNGTISMEAAGFLRTLVEARYNIMICGGTSTGKTSFLNALSNFIFKDERIITIEDSSELQLSGIDNLVCLETRNANAEGKGCITISDLIRASLRMRPERIIVGEVRGGEALDMLQAMNTGHEGSISTGHANSCKDMLTRLETMVLSAAGLPLEAIKKQIASAVNILIHLARMTDKSRKVTEISELAGIDDRGYIMNTLFLMKDGEMVSSGNDLINLNKLNHYKGI